MRSLFFFVACAAIAGSSFAGQRVDPILAIPITDDFLSDRTIREFFADLLEQGGYGHWRTERAAFVVLDERGQYRCIGWDLDGRLLRQEFQGAIPDRTVAIVHTHPKELPIGSVTDQETAMRLSVPIFVLTPDNIYMVSARGNNVALVENRSWAPARSSSRPCSPPRPSRSENR